MATAAGLAIGAAGTYLSAREQRRGTRAAAHAARFRPFSVYGGGGGPGSITVGDDGRVNLHPDQNEVRFSQGLRDSGMSQLNRGMDDLNGINAPGMINAPGIGRRIAAPVIGGRVAAPQVGNRIGVQSFTPQLRGLATHSALNPNQFGELMQQGRQVSHAGMDNMGDAFRQAGQQGRLGQQFLGQAGSMDINQLAAGRLQQLNSLATPFEDREAAGLADRLFASGRAGTTGGAREFGDLAQSLERAQTERLLAASQFASDEQNRMVGLGQGLIGSGQQTALGGLQGAMMGQDNMSGLIGARAGLVGQQFQQLLGTSQDAQARAGLLMNQENSLFQQRLGRSQFQLGQEDSLFNRRLSNSQFQLGQEDSLFNRRMGRAGFMSDQRQQHFANRMGLANTRMAAGSGALGLSQEFNPFNQLMQMGGLSATLSGAASGAGAAQGQFIQQGSSARAGMIGSMFGGIAQGVMNRT